MKTDIEISREFNKRNIEEIANRIGLNQDEFELYGKYKAKIDLSVLERKDKAQVILVTAMTPTKMGEGKTTTTIGLVDGLNEIGINTIGVLREPSLGPVFGIKGGATGGGYAQVVPMEDINLHFTGDFHAITSANNLLCAILDNHIYHGNELNIDLKKIKIKRVIDMNDRQLRHIISGIGNKSDGVVREDGFDITVASEMMAIFCLSKDFLDLKNRIANIVVAYDKAGNEVTAEMLKATGAISSLLKDAIKPNLIQTLYNNPVIMHGGPFANIAHGCNSIIATKMGMKLADVVVTEAGFGADLGAEKFFDIKCRVADIKPKVAIIVATIRALKFHGGFEYENLKNEDIEKLDKGFENLKRHIEMTKNLYNINTIVVINKFPTDTDKELIYIINKCNEIGVVAKISKAYEEGGKGSIELAREVKKLLNQNSNFTMLYEDRDSISDKINKVVREVYHGKGYTLTKKAENELKLIENSKYANLPICIAKTQYSFSDNPLLIGAPEEFIVTISDIKVSAGAGFIVVYLGDIMTMPGLPKEPASINIDVDSNMNIIGIF